MSKRRALRTKLPNEAKKPVLLYRLVFLFFPMRIVVFLIFGFFVLQPTSMIYANQTTTAEVSIPEEVSEVPDLEIVEVDDEVMAKDEEEIVMPEEITLANELSDDEIEANTLQVEANEEDNIIPDTEELPITETATNDLATTSVATTTDIIITSTSSPVTQASTTAGNNEINSTTTPIVTEVAPVVASPELIPDTSVPIDPVLDEKIDVIEEPIITPTESVTIMTNDDNRYQFGVEECVSVGEEAFYCNKQSTSSVAAGGDGAYVEFDEDGDTEIYYREHNSVIKITNNKLDDLAPYYDAKSNSIVWHRLIDGRYEIISFNIDKNVETQLTSNNINDMEPSRSGNLTVWQRWNDDNWDIMLYDGDAEKQISDSPHHDVAPAIREGYIIWHTTNDSGEKLLSVYEIATGHISAIADPDGGHVENPRFVLVYDTAYENGDIITKQYDPETGEIKTVGSLPASPTAPPVIPEPDSTGETRALINTKTSSRDEHIIDSDEPITKPTASSTPETVLGESDVNDIQLTSTSTSIADVNLATTTPEVTVLPLTEFDVIVLPYQDASSSAPNVSAATSTGS